MTIKETIETEKQKLKNMTFKDKIWYIAEYYKLHILGLIMVIGFVYFVGNTLYRQTFDTRLSISIINDPRSSVYAEALQNELRTELDCGPKDLIELDNSLMLSFNQDAMTQYDYAGAAKLSALIGSQSLDIVIADKALMEHYGASSAFLNLEQALDPQLYDKIKEDILVVTDADGASCPAAISLKHSILADRPEADMEPLYVAVMNNSPHITDSSRALRYLFP